MYFIIYKFEYSGKKLVIEHIYFPYYNSHLKGLNNSVLYNSELLKKGFILVMFNDVRVDFARYTTLSKCLPVFDELQTG